MARKRKQPVALAEVLDQLPVVEELKAEPPKREVIPNRITGPRHRTDVPPGNWPGAVPLGAGNRARFQVFPGRNQVQINFDLEPPKWVRERMKEEGWNYFPHDHKVWTFQRGEGKIAAVVRTERFAEELFNDIRAENGLGPIEYGFYR